MAYDRLSESRKMFAQGVPDIPFKLTRRRRFIPLAFDVDGDVGATLFLRRGVNGNPWLEAWSLERRDDEWTVLGGGSGDGYDHLFEPRQSIEGLVLPCGSGWTARGARRLLPSSKGVSHAEMRLGSQVAALRVADRTIEVPSHGMAIAVWSSRRPPTVTAFSPTGETLGEIPLRR
ncbi:MAG: hypothetical protein HKN24_07770 [Acidimicrobiales bacterium]|nr:hypothetical protein [Acidimicrobiales bacterium]